MLPKDIAKLVPRTHLMSESEWRNLGVQQSQGWVHYMIHEPGEPLGWAGPGAPCPFAWLCPWLGSGVSSLGRWADAGQQEAAPCGLRVISARS